MFVVLAQAVMEVRVLLELIALRQVVVVVAQQLNRR
jgi:hypothetical protein